jgi:hypothetical protein
MRSTSMITGDALSNIDDGVSAGLSALADAGSFELSDSAGRNDIGRDDPK